MNEFYNKCKVLASPKFESDDPLPQGPLPHFLSPVSVLFMDEDLAGNLNDATTQVMAYNQVMLPPHPSNIPNLSENNIPSAVSAF